MGQSCSIIHSHHKHHKENKTDQSKMAGSRVWLITGATSGFGLELAKLVASRGDRVIATSRNPKKLSDLPEGIATARLDQNESLPQIQAAMNDIINIHGTIDIVVANASYVQLGMVEECSPEDTLKQFQANVFGPLNVYRAILPHMREKRAGTLVTFGSMGAWFSINGCNLYMASKAAVRNVSLGLAEEIKPFGIRHCLVEPGFFRTALLTPGKSMTGKLDVARIPDYAEMNKAADGAFKGFDGAQIGDPKKGVSILYDVITSTGVAAGREFPGFIPLGSDAIAEIKKDAQKVIDDINAWESIVTKSDITDGK
ncbi:hypothetical protein F4818DRAFT_423005 [Hypoxylon cercidicola]|nr:hypothetical protein F4818DRAFT_423005 [Hypoxylon cercidicola]